jgi:hypothetical protein
VAFSFPDFTISPNFCPNAISYTMVDAANIGANQDSSPPGLMQPTSGTNEIIP